MRRFCEELSGNRELLMSPEQREFLNPCEKWRRFGRIPWKLFTHVSLALIFSVLVYCWTENSNEHTRQTLGFFSRKFVPENLVSSRNDLDAAVHRLMTDFWAINGQSELDSFAAGEKGVWLELRRRGEASVKMELSRSWEVDVKKALVDLRNVHELFFVLHVTDFWQGVYWPEIYRWRIFVIFSFSGSGLITTRLDYRLKLSPDSLGPGNFFSLLPLIALVLLVISTILTVRSHMIAAKGWFAFTLLGHFLQSLACLTCLRLFSASEDVSLRAGLLGMSSLMAWISVLRYLRHFSTYYVLVRTLNLAIPQVGRFCAGVAPIVFGYALLGTSLFWQSSNFQDVSSSVLTLFSVLNGDMIHDAFVDLRSFAPLGGPLYLASFIFLFMYVVLNVFLSIVEESFSAATKQETEFETVLMRGESHEDNGWAEGVKANLAVMARSDGARRNFQVLKEFIDSELNRL